MEIFHPIAELLAKIEDSNAEYIKEVLRDYWICLVSRECSLTARKEVLTGKAKFGILGDGKEVPQVAMARAFEKGDFRSGYYRDQTFMMALGLCSVQDYFAQLYADTEHDKFSKGRQMNAHFATAFIDEEGEWLDWIELYNSGATSVSLTGYYLSDKKNNPTKWAIPAGVSIAANGFVRIWASGRSVVNGRNILGNNECSSSPTGSNGGSSLG